MDPQGEVKPDPRSALPSVDRLVREAGVAHPDLPRWALTAAAREVLAAARSGEARVEQNANWVAKAARVAENLSRPRPGRVVNATGIVLHTNLGRAPLPGEAMEVAARAAGYSDLELDLGSGRRGQRLGRLGEKLCLLAGSEAAYACNNNAAAVMLALDSLARGREVVVSRGELVEIGGSFRVPEIMERAGVRLVEVGTTNRTHARDYEAAIGPDTALLLKVHRSNFAVSGFVAEVDLQELAPIAARHGLPILEDLGSGTLVDLSAHGFPAESHAPSRLRAGADLCCFSGDKLLGGPQAGIAIGRRDIVDAMRRNPLARALRLDKVSLSLLDWTLARYLEGEAERALPTLRHLLEDEESLARRANELAERVAKASDAAGLGLSAEVAAESSPVGGGSLPGFDRPTRVVLLRGARPDALASALREAATPVVARVRDDALVLDVRSIGHDEGALIESAFRALDRARLDA